MNPFVKVIVGDALQALTTLEEGTVQTCVTSPPYWGLRDYGTGDAQLGLEPTSEAYVNAMVAVFREVRRVLRDDGTLWLNLGDSYAGARSGPQGQSGEMASREVSCHRGMVGTTKAADGCKPKDLVGIPWMVAFALRADGWYLRSDIIWAKPNPMPESVRDRPTKAHEYLFLLSKKATYYYDADAIREEAEYGRREQPTGDARPWGHLTSRAGNRTVKGSDPSAGRNKRSVWTVATEPYPEAHFATFPSALIRPCVLAGSREGDTVLDPFAGSGTTLEVAQRLGRKAIGIELNPAYAELIRKRIASVPMPMFAGLNAPYEEETK